MQLIEKDGVTLAYEDINPGLPPMPLVHGWGCDHTSLDAQAEFFSKSHRVVSVKLRGHRKSDAPDQDYTMPSFADDLAWLCEKLGLIKPIVIGHSMGGSIVLELAAGYPDVPASIVLLNSFVFVPQPILDLQKVVLDGIKESDYVPAYRESLARLFIPTDNGQKKEHFLDLIREPPSTSHVCIRESRYRIRWNLGRNRLPCTCRADRRCNHSDLTFPFGLLSKTDSAAHPCADVRDWPFRAVDCA
jgi:pimeloyl-ACP methyl ester carboxylesterase